MHQPDNTHSTDGGNYEDSIPQNAAGTQPESPKAKRLTESEQRLAERGLSTATAKGKPPLE